MLRRGLAQAGALLIALLLGMMPACAPGWDGCQDVCAGGVPGYSQYLCDGGPCIGGGQAVRYDQCLCSNNQAATYSFVYPEPTDQASCDKTKSDWQALVAAQCR
jgi:hypothetical protein